MKMLEAVLVVVVVILVPVSEEILIGLDVARKPSAVKLLKVVQPEAKQHLSGVRQVFAVLVWIVLSPAC